MRPAQRGSQPRRPRLGDHARPVKEPLTAGISTPLTSTILEFYCEQEKRENTATCGKNNDRQRPKMEAFTFGEPVPVLDRRDIWITSSVSVTADGMSHRSALPSGKKPACCRASQLTDLRQTHILASTFIPHPWLSQQDFSRLCWIFWCSVMRFWKSDTAPP